MRANATAPAYVSAAAPAAARDTRERGLALVSRVNRWMVAGAVVVAGGVTAVTAHAFHPHQAVVRTAAPASSAASSQPSAPAPSDNGGGLQAPSAPPQSVAPAAPAPVVSGGS